MMQYKKFNFKKTLLTTFSAVILLASVAIPLITTKPKKAAAAPTVTITSPSEGQSISGTNFTAAGTATPNTTVVLSSGGVSFAQTISDGSGNWSVTTSLPAGNINLTARAIQNPEYGYFVTTDFSSSTIHRLTISNNAIDASGPYPLDTNGTFPYLLMPSPTQDTFYSGNFLINSVIPAKFDASTDSAPVTVSGSYPSDPGANKGDFNAAGTLYFAPNLNGGNVSVINTATNSWQQNITLGTGDEPVTATLSPDNLLYVSVINANKTYILNTTTFAEEGVLETPCLSATSVFSKDANYPYFFKTCVDSPQILKYRKSDLSLVETWNVGMPSAIAQVSLDNKKIYVAGASGSGFADKVKVISTENGTPLHDTIQLSADSVGFLATPDFQKLYVATPGGSFDTQNIDIIDLETYAVQSIATPGIPGPPIASPTEIAETSVQVAFVLGVSTGASSTAIQKLAETGAIGISSTLLIGIIIAVTSYLYLDYRAHKKPLKAEDPHVKYTFLHHIRVVSMPRLKYRVAVTVSVSKRSSK